MTPPIVFDLDLDFFVWPIAHVGSEAETRLPDAEFTPDTVDEVRDFLESKLHLKQNHPIPGKIVKHHKEVFDLWKQLIAAGQLQTPFSLLHADAHHDVDGIDFFVHSGNFITHAVNSDWLQFVEFVTLIHTQPMPWVYRKRDPLRLSVQGHEVTFRETFKQKFEVADAVRPDFLFLACSPGFTPKSADVLIPLIAQYIKEI